MNISNKKSISIRILSLSVLMAFLTSINLGCALTHIPSVSANDAIQFDVLNDQAISNAAVSCVNEIEERRRVDTRLNAWSIILSTGSVASSGINAGFIGDDRSKSQISTLNITTIILASGGIILQGARTFNSPEKVRNSYDNLQGASRHLVRDNLSDSRRHDILESLQKCRNGSPSTK
jgi:hypothetical protein